MGRILLIGATITALLWANLAPASYEGFWSANVDITIGNLTLGSAHFDLKAFANDDLMAVFFFFFFFFFFFGPARRGISSADPLRGPEQ